MKLFSVLVLAISVVTAVYYEEFSEGKLKPQFNSSLKWVSREEYERYDCNGDIANFFLYSPKKPNSTTQLTNGDVKGLKKSLFDSSYPTRFIIHGWKEDEHLEMCYILLSAFFSVANYNIICVDWSHKSQRGYFEAKKCVPDVGKKVAKMIDFLHKEGDMSFETLLVAGYNLGAHVAGFAGKNVKNGRVHQIIGMDPTYLGFSYNEPDKRLAKNDAFYVEVIHTKSYSMSSLRPIGKADFFGNVCTTYNGFNKICSFIPFWKPINCKIGKCLNSVSDGPLFAEALQEIMHECVDIRSYVYYAEAILLNDIVTKKCNTYEDAIKETCNISTSVRLGSSENYLHDSGIFYISINEEKNI